MWPRSGSGHPIALRQILANLIGDAVKFTPAGSIDVIVATKDRAVDAITLHTAVSDTGIGIEADAVDRIFNEFTQASYDTAVKFGGTGLGLAITRRLLGLYGSSIDVVSIPGKGSTFSFNLRFSLQRAAAD